MVQGWRESEGVVGGRKRASFECDKGEFYVMPREQSRGKKIPAGSTMGQSQSLLDFGCAFQGSLFLKLAVGPPRFGIAHVQYIIVVQSRSRCCRPARRHPAGKGHARPRYFRPAQLHLSPPIIISLFHSAHTLCLCQLPFPFAHLRFSLGFSAEREQHTCCGLNLFPNLQLHQQIPGRCITSSI